MKVLLDVTSLLPKNLTGQGIYTKHLFRLLRGIGVEVSPVYKIPRGIKENYIESHISASAKKFYGIFNSKGTILHGPSGNLLSESNKFKKVLSVNDLSMFRGGMMPPNFAEQLQTHLKQQMQQNVSAVIVPSYEVHNEFLVRFPRFVDRVHVVTPGCDHILDSSSAQDNKLVSNPYFLFVGLIDKRSNIAGVVKAFDAFCAIKKDIQLVIAGDNGYGSELIHKLIESSSFRERYSIVGYKTGASLKKLYSEALGTIIPSYYEGFSFPLVESLRMGCPVVTSGLGAMKEIGADAVHLVNPKDPEQIMGGMERIYADRVYKEKLVSAGEEITQGMTWLNCAKNIAKIYQSLQD